MKIEHEDCGKNSTTQYPCKICGWINDSVHALEQEGKWIVTGPHGSVAVDDFYEGKRGYYQEFPEVHHAVPIVSKMSPEEIQKYMTGKPPFIQLNIISAVREQSAFLAASSTLSDGLKFYELYDVCIHMLAHLKPEAKDSFMHQLSFCKPPGL